MRKIILIVICFISISSKTKECEADKFILRRLDKSYVLRFIESHENPIERYKGKAHDDGTGNKTIGFGHKVLSNENYSYLSISEARILLDKDFLKVSDYVKSKFVWLNTNQHLAACHIAYCLGIGRLNRLISNGCELDTIRLKKYVNINKKPNKYLIEQRRFEIDLWFK